jgi:AcrR family transcriptional regulator
VHSRSSVRDDTAITQPGCYNRNVEQEIEQQESVGSGNRESVASRDALIEVTLAYLATHGEAQLRVGDIARRAGVTTGAIYGHFGNRAGLLAAAYAKRMTEIVTNDLAIRRMAEESYASDPAHDPDYVAYARNILSDEGRQARLRWLEGVIRAQHDVHLAALLKPIKRETLDLIADALRQSQQLGYVRDDLDARAIAVVAFATGLGMSALLDVYDDPTVTEDIEKAWTIGTDSYRSEPS